MLTIGVDTHKATLAASAIDDAGRELSARTFRNDRQGHTSLLRWARAHGSERRFGIEGSGSYGAGLARLMSAAGETVVEVPAVRTERERRHLGRAGKSDPGDALAIARVTLREQSLGPIQVAGIAEDLKLLSTHATTASRNGHEPPIASTRTSWCSHPGTRLRSITSRRQLTSAPPVA